MNILEKIIGEKRLEVQRHKEAVSLATLEKLLKDKRECLSFRQSLLQSESGIISEFKRRSPSRDWIFQDAKVEEVVPAYAREGAAAISVLTDEPFFGGRLKDLQTARSLVDSTPLLRKDFIVDEYQIYQARLMGADVILLIAAALTVEQTCNLARLARQLGLEVLLEIHCADELGHINEYVDVVGVNNRNLSTFVTDIQTSYALSERIPAECVKISESGISEAQTVADLRQAGFRGFLMGENFMKTGQPGEALRTFIAELKTLSA